MVIKPNKFIYRTFKKGLLKSLFNHSNVQKYSSNIIDLFYLFVVQCVQ